MTAGNYRIVLSLTKCLSLFTCVLYNKGYDFGLVALLFFMRIAAFSCITDLWLHDVFINQSIVSIWRSNFVAISRDEEPFPVSLTIVVFFQCVT